MCFPQTCAAAPAIRISSRRFARSWGERSDAAHRQLRTAAGGWAAAARAGTVRCRHFLSGPGPYAGGPLPGRAWSSARRRHRSCSRNAGCGGGLDRQGRCSCSTNRLPPGPNRGLERFRQPILAQRGCAMSVSRWLSCLRMTHISRRMPPSRSIATSGSFRPASTRPAISAPSMTRLPAKRCAGEGLWRCR